MLTVSWVIDWFLANDLRATSTVARVERVRVLRLFVGFINRDGRRVGDLRVAEAKGADLAEFVARQKLARWTVRRWVSTVKRPFNEAARLGLIPGCPFSGVRAPKGRRGRDLCTAEFRAALRHATPAFRRVLVFLRFSGARPGELRRLEWGHVRELARTIVQAEHKTALTADEPRPRCIRLNPVLVKLLAWLKRHDRGSRYVFTNAYGGQWTIWALCKNMRLIRRRAGLPADAKLYGCRHAFATGAVLNGVDIATLAQLMGHASVKTTEWYLHLAGKDDHLAEAAARAVSALR